MLIKLVFNLPYDLELCAHSSKMNIFVQSITLYSVLIKILADKVISEEDKDRSGNEGHSQNKMSIDDDRRSLDDLSDEQWHVSHLKESVFEISGPQCEDDTIYSKIRRYKESLRRDAAFIDFVSANALTLTDKVSMNELCKKKKDKAHSDGQIKATTVKETTSVKSTPALNATTSNATTSNVTTNNVTSSNVTVAKEAKKEQKDTATTPNVKKTAKEDLKDKQAKESRKAGDYLFSSVEYYDEEPSFDPTGCEGSVVVIDLEIDTLRNYDIECEQMLQWRSLE